MAAVSSTNSIDFQIESIVFEILNVSYLEEAFGTVIVYNEDAEEERKQRFFKQMNTFFSAIPSEQKDNALKNYFTIVGKEHNANSIKVLLEVIGQLVSNNILPARLVSEQLLACEYLVYTNKIFWNETFALIKKILNGVDYKGVREIMKGCRDKIQSFPQNINLCFAAQLTAVEEVIEYIFNRDACLLPAYFIANEIQKSGPLHWKISELTSSFVEDFRNIAQMVSIIGHSHMLPIVEHFGYTENLINPWRLDSTTLKFSLRGILPYDSELSQPQTKLLRYILEQPYSKDMICSMLSIQKQNKQRCIAVEEQLVWLIMSAMERSEKEPLDNGENDETFSSIHWLWVHISSQLIYFVLLQFASFPNIVTTLHDRLAIKKYRRGRDYLMWSLLQFISGSIQRNPLSNFMSVLSLYDILYPEKEPLAVPDCSKPYATRQMAPTCIWIHLNKKAQSEQINLHRQVPIALKKHEEFLQHLLLSNNTLTMGSDFIIVLLCNAYSTNPDIFTRPMAALFETINKSPVGTTQQPMPTVPLPMVKLDSLTVHAKMSLIHSIVAHMMKQAQTKNTSPMSTMGMAPALVETYSRLLVYTEIESLGIKGFLGQLLPTVFKYQSWGIMHTLLEMLSYRMHHIQPFYRIQLLSHLHSLSSVPHTNQTQLHLCVETTALKLITGLGSAEVQPQLSRYFTDPKIPGSIVWAESEELNRALILTIARSMHITGTGTEDTSNAWCKELLTSIMQNTPHSWATHTLQCFPPILNTFFTQNNLPKENKQLLKKSVEDEYLKWNQMSNENELMAHFTAQGAQPHFLCLLLKIIVETDDFNPVSYKILERIGARALSLHLRKLCDYLIHEVATSGGNHQIKKCVDSIGDLVWKYNVLTLDRLLLCLALRTCEGSEAQVCFYVIQMLLMKAHEFRNRVVEFVKENSPDHWKQNNWYEKHMAFHQKFREKFTSDESTQQMQLPVYFGNVCLRFLPVLDIVIHRFVEVNVKTVHKTLETILNHFGCLYKFHDRPITYLYNTLHFYERNLRDHPDLKKHLVAAVIGSLSDIRPSNWALTEQCQRYIREPETETSTAWTPDLNYYIELVRRIADTISGNNIFYLTDWRFNEFPNASAHALYVTCVELLSLPISASIVANSIIDVIIKGYTIIPSDEIHGWINVIGLLMTALPETYWSAIYDRLQEIVMSNKMVKWPYRASPFEMFNFKIVKEAMLDNNYVLLLAIAQSILHHSSIGQIVKLASYIKENLKPHVMNEYQLIYVCHLFGPFILRLDQERPKVGYDIMTNLYELLEQVDKNHGDEPFKYMDSICDLLYHIKYMFVGDLLKVETETIIRRLRPALQMRLRFITHLNVEEITANPNTGDKKPSTISVSSSLTTTTTTDAKQ